MPQSDRDIRPRDVISIRSAALCVVADMSPVELEIDLFQALGVASRASPSKFNSTGFDDEIRAFEAGQGQEEMLSWILPEDVIDPFEEVLAQSFNKVLPHSPFEFPTEIPDLAVMALL